MFRPFSHRGERLSDVVKNHNFESSQKRVTQLNEKSREKTREIPIYYLKR